MMRHALAYGAWSALFAFVTAMFLGTYREIRGGSVPSISRDDFQILFVLSFTVFAVALIGWGALHSGKRRPRWIGYSILAIAVVVVTQSLLSAPILIGGLKAGPVEFVKLTVGTLIKHGWFTVPIALGGTALFVWWLKRDATARPSRAGHAGWRS